MFRRLPVYLLVDTSSSMRGNKIATVERGIKELIESLKREPMALETAFISVITFATEVKQVVPLSDLFHWNLPELKAGGRTYLGKALTFLKECADREVRKNTPEAKGDWRPIVFIMADGGSTDAITKVSKAFNQRKWGNVVACAIGEKANVEQLSKITPTVVRLKDGSETDLTAFFKWVSASISTASTSVGAGADFSEKLPPLPPEIILI